MVCVLTRVSEAFVVINGEERRGIGAGLLALLGVSEGDTEKEALYLASKAAALRIFPDEGGKMNLSVLDTGGEMLIISNFTLLADCKKGRRPDFTCAAAPKKASVLYEAFIEECKRVGITRVISGEFGADMKVSSVNDGPVTVILDTDHMLGGQR